MAALAAAVAAAAWLTQMPIGEDRFLAIVGHELRNPLNPMSAALEVLKEEERTLACARGRGC